MIGSAMPRRAQPPADLVVNAAALAVALPTIARSGGGAATRATATFAVCAVAERVAVDAVRRHTASAPSPADALTFARAASGTLLLALAAVGARRPTEPATRLGFVAALAGATLADWLDGPIARRATPTLAGAVLDIEADSWLTLCAAIAATRWGVLSRWTLTPPALRYLDPIAARRRGAWFTGGGSTWSRMTGAAQMGLLLTALAPLERPRLTRFLRGAGLLVTAAQLATQAADRGAALVARPRVSLRCGKGT